MQPSARDDTSEFASTLLIAAMLLLWLALELRDPFGVAWGRAAVPGLALLGLGVAAVALPGARARGAAVAFLQMTAFTLAAVALSYACAAAGGGLWDARLAAADRALGLDWPAVRAALDAEPVLVWAGALAYHSLIGQMVAVILALAAAGRVEQLRAAVCAAVLGGFATILLAAAMPAVGNLFDPAAYRHLWPSVAWQERGIIAGLRDGSLRVLDLSAMMGIVSFPSYHATLAAIFVWAFRGVRWGRVGGAWAVLTILATPVFGGHYVVDVLAGLALAPVCVAAARRLVRVDAQAFRAAWIRAAAWAAPSEGIRIRSAARR